VRRACRARSGRRVDSDRLTRSHAENKSVRYTGGELAAAHRHTSMSLKRKIAMRPGPSRPRAVVATPRVPASAEQRRKVAGTGCLICGRSPVDPAHVVPRRLGGCDSPDSAPAKFDVYVICVSP
jgi:hypothetical protein